MASFLFPDTSIIYALDLLAVVLTLYEMRVTLQNRFVAFLVGNNAALRALVNGKSLT